MLRHDSSIIFKFLVKQLVIIARSESERLFHARRKPDAKSSLNMQTSSVFKAPLYIEVMTAFNAEKQNDGIPGVNEWHGMF